MEFFLTCFLVAGASVNAQNSQYENWTPLWYVIRLFLEYIVIVPSLRRKNSSSEHSSLRVGIFFYSFAILKSNMEIVQTLVNAHANVNLGGTSPLLLAVSFNNMQIVEFLLAHGMFLESLFFLFFIPGYILHGVRQFGFILGVFNGQDPTLPRNLSTGTPQSISRRTLVIWNGSNVSTPSDVMWYGVFFFLTPKAYGVITFSQFTHEKWLKKTKKIWIIKIWKKGKKWEWEKMRKM